MLSFYLKESLDITKIKDPEHSKESEVDFSGNLGRGVLLLSILFVIVYAASKTTASEGLRTGTRNWQAMQSGTHFAKTGGFRSHGTRLFHACWGAAPIPAEQKTYVLKRWINPSAARFCKSLVGGKLSAAPPLFPVVHSLPPAPCPVPEYGRYWL